MTTPGKAVVHSEPRPTPSDRLSEIGPRVFDFGTMYSRISTLTLNINERAGPTEKQSAQVEA